MSGSSLERPGAGQLMRRYTEGSYGAKSWKRDRRVAARIKASRQAFEIPDIGFMVINLANGSAEWLHDPLYCARGQAENLIKLYKSQLASDHTSCRSALPNQVRPVLHAAAYCWCGRPRRHRCARMGSLLISDKGDGPWTKLAELGWIRRSTFFSFMGSMRLRRRFCARSCGVRRS